MQKEVTIKVWQLKDDIIDIPAWLQKADLVIIYPIFLWFLMSPPDYLLFLSVSTFLQCCLRFSSLIVEIRQIQSLLICTVFFIFHSVFDICIGVLLIKICIRSGSFEKAHPTKKKFIFKTRISNLWLKKKQPHLLHHILQW